MQKYGYYTILTLSCLDNSRFCMTVESSQGAKSLELVPKIGEDLLFNTNYALAQDNLRVVNPRQYP